MSMSYGEQAYWGLIDPEPLEDEAMQIIVTATSRHNGEILKAAGVTAQIETPAARKQGELMVCKALSQVIVKHLEGLTTERAGVVDSPLNELLEEAALFTEYLLLAEVETNDPVLKQYKETLRETLGKLLENAHTYRPTPAARKIQPAGAIIQP